ncbi:hypothetical protein NIES2104_33670 [Leptolyngbya sp. NIES-2104]|nr:hypothetical protein NIES2104_33670 [Leptolyngbya sp. NIES-2104]
MQGARYPEQLERIAGRCSAIVPELLNAVHQVLGLAQKVRSGMGAI